MTVVRRIAVATGSRADYGLLKALLQDLKASDGIELQLIVSGMHLASQFGETWRAIEQDGFAIAARVDLELRGDDANSVSRSTGIGVIGFSNALSKLKPNLLIVLGDRFEILAAAVAATILNIPIAHIHGGEVTAGAFDDAIRHAITKMACLHFVAAEPYRQRVIQMGENPDLVFNVGAPGLDQLHDGELPDRAVFLRRLGIGGPDRFLLITLHPTTARPELDAATITALLRSLSEIRDRSFVFTGVNADPGHGAIDQAIRQFVDKHGDRAGLFASLGSERYWTALRLADAVVGNSSSGILEAPAAGTPSVNIGDRQLGRLRAASAIDCPIDASAITSALTSILDGRFTFDPNAELPYGRGGASAKIAAVVKEIELGDLLPKHFRDLR